MKLISTCAFAILLMGVIGCDERRARVDAGTDAFVPRVDAFVPPPDAFVSRDAGRDGGRDAFSGGGMCVSRCTANAQCQSSCPTPPGGGTNCCDVRTNSCYPTAFAMCPAAAPDAGMMMPPY